MKALWLLFLPIAIFGSKAYEGLFDLDDHKEDFLQHLSFDDEKIDEAFDKEKENLSLLEVDEKDANLGLWSREELSAGDISSYLDRRASQIEEEYEDVFAYEISGKITPTHEKISAEKRKLLSRPRIVEAPTK